MTDITKVLSSNFLIWNRLNAEEKKKIADAVIVKNLLLEKPFIMEVMTALGLIILVSGSLRTYMMNENGKQITLYRLFDKDICLFFCFLYDERYNF